MAYRSIFMAPDWMHVRYFGWADGWPDPALRVMTQRRGGLWRTLAVSELAEPAALARHWPRIASASPFAELRFHDLTGSPRIAGWLAARGLAPLGAGERMLNVATIAIDLSRDDDALLADLAADARRLVRRAEAAGFAFRDDAHRDPALLAAFLGAHDRMARERGLQRHDPAMVARMIADGRARLFATIHDGAPRNFMLSYETADIGFIASTAAIGRENEGGGYLLYWGAIRAFRAAGHRWCDAGGLGSTDPNDGIVRFKKKFGGTLVDLGAEYGRSGVAVRVARALRRRIGHAA